MKLKHESITIFIEQFQRIINKYNDVDTKPYNFGIDDNLFPSEIHTIDAIGKNNGINVTQLSYKLGITKGAVSQMVNKLKMKGLVNKFKDTDNNKEIILILTDLGKKAYEGHIRFHMAMYNDFITMFDNYSSEQFNQLKHIFNKIEFYLDHYLE